MKPQYRVTFYKAGWAALYATAAFCLGLLIIVAGCAEVNMTPAWQQKVVMWNATEQQIARWAAAPDACDTCVGELTREQARTFLVQRAAMWQEIVVAMRGGDPNE